MMSYDRMHIDERAACASLAARAFMDYEYFTDYIPDDRRRARFLDTLMEIELRINNGPATFFTAKDDGTIVALAMLCPPDYVKPSALGYMKAGFGKCFLRGGIRDVTAWNDMEGKAGEPCHRLGRKTWYLNLLTVEPSAKGRGVGSAMLQECLIPFVKEQGGNGLCLFTNSQENRRFYQKNGFREFDERWFEYKGHRLGSWSYRLEW